MKQCKCSLRIKAVGDGCAVCNPARAADYTGEILVENLEKQPDSYRGCQHSGAEQCCGGAV